VVISTLPGETERAFNIRKKSISAEMSKQLPKAEGLQNMRGHIITLLTLKTLPPLIKVVPEQTLEASLTSITN